MNQQPTNTIGTVPLFKFTILTGCCLLLLCSFTLFYGTWQRDFIGKDEDVFSNIPQHIGENIDFCKVQPHTPFTALSFIFFQKFFPNIFLHYLINWIIHTLNTLLLFNLLARINKNLISSIVSFLLSCLFLIHPSNIYSSSFLINRGGLLASLFTLLILTILYTKHDALSSHLSYLFFAIVLIFLSTFSHFIAVVSIVPFFYFSYRCKLQNDSSKHLIIYGCAIFSVLFFIFIFLVLYQNNLNRDLYQIYPPFKFFNVISGFFILTLFPTNFFPLQHFEINSLLNIPIVLTVLLFLLILGFYFFINSKFLPFLSCVLAGSSLVVYPLFQKLDISMCNCSYFLILNIILFCYFLFQSINDKNKIIGRLITLFFIIILGSLSIFSFQLTHELRDPERLWLACAGNYPSNTEAWKYLARTLTKKMRQEPTSKNIYLEKAEQAWNTLLELQPENTEALREKSLLCLANGRYDESKKYIEKSIGLNPFDTKSIRTQIKIIESKIEAGDTSEYTLLQLYNSYMSLYCIEKKLTKDEKLKFLRIARKLSNYEQAWEILRHDLDTLDNIIEKDDFKKRYDDIQKSLNTISATPKSTGEIFKAPYLTIADYYENKGLLSLSTAWLSFGLQNEQDNKDLLIKLGIIYGKMEKPGDFTEKWGGSFNNDDKLWEKLVQECININNFTSAYKYMENTSYSKSKKYIVLSTMAIEKGYHEQAKLWIEKAKENTPTSDEIQKINEIINKIPK